MARIRTIKPEFPQSESVGRLSRDARLCFILLWTLADDSGRLRGNSRMLASLLYPYDEDAGKLMDAWLAELDLEGCTRRYKIGTDTYVELCNWLKHQKIDKPSASKIPEFDESSRILANPREGSSGDLRIKDQGSRNVSRTKDQGPTSSVSPTEADSPEMRVFEFWRTTYGHPRAKLDAKRQKVLREALKGYSESDLCLAIGGYRNSAHHMGRNDRNAVYDDIELFLRDAKHIDAGIKFAESPQRADLSAQTKRIIDQTADWVPPEMR